MKKLLIVLTCFLPGLANAQISNADSLLIEKLKVEVSVYVDAASKKMGEAIALVEKANKLVDDIPISSDNITKAQELKEKSQILIRESKQILTDAANDYLEKGNNLMDKAATYTVESEKYEACITAAIIYLAFAENLSQTADIYDEAIEH